MVLYPCNYYVLKCEFPLKNSCVRHCNPYSQAALRQNIHHQALIMRNPYSALLNFHITLHYLLLTSHRGRSGKNSLDYLYMSTKIIMGTPGEDFQELYC